MKFRRAIRHWWQRRTRGWDSSELWSLDHTIAKFVLPRLKEFRRVEHGHPSAMTETEWVQCLDKMIAAFEIAAGDDYFCMNDEQRKIKDDGLQLFAKHFSGLWL